MCNLLNRIIIVSALLLAPMAIFAAETAPAAAPVSSSYGTNSIFIGLVSLVLILLFAIGVVGNVLNQLSRVCRDKIREDKKKAAGLVKTLALFVVFSSLAATAFAADPAPAAAAAPAATSIFGINPMDFYFLMGLIIFELTILIAMSFHVRILTRSLSAKPEDANAPAVVKETVWDMLNASVAIEKEKDIMLDHDYDGIHELDNSLPPWWKYGFYLTILVACIYLYKYHVSGTGLSSKEEYEQEMAQAEADKAIYLSKSANNIDENSVTLMMAPGDIAAGKATFMANCVACHLADGGGGVGPNLTDDYWIHGGSVKDIFKTIKYGWQDKGMKSWKDDFSPLQIAQLASFVKSLHGTTPAVAKEKQGELYVEGGAVAPAPAAKDSTAKVDSAKADKKK